jgi:hypothetical protein
MSFLTILFLRDGCYSSALGRCDLRTGLWVGVVVFSYSLCSFAQKSNQHSTSKAAASPAMAAEDSSRLPVKRVVLYKNGVGYFEHSANVRGNQELAIDFTTAQLNDVLKSLTSVDLGDGHISGVRYNSIAPLDERLKALRLPFGEDVTRADFLSALRGARVDVRSGTLAATGRLLSVEDEQRTTEKGTTYKVTIFSVMTDSGEMRNFELGPAVSVRLAERDLTDEVGRYLNLVGSSRARDLRRMTISATGSGEREIFVSYISEVPVWKSTYRIILPQKQGEKPLLQGWAIVDNTIGEDWKNVQLSLIAGSPQSFIQDISQPLYARRPVIPLPQSAMLTPQTHEATMKDETENLPAPPPPTPPGVGSGVGGGMHGSVFAFKAAKGSGLEGTVTDPSGAVVGGASVVLRNTRTGASQTAWTDSNGYYQFATIQGGPAEITVTSPGFQTTKVRTNLRPRQGNRADATLSVGSTAETVEVEAQQTAQEQAALALPVNGRNYAQFSELPILQSRIEAEKVTLWSAGQRPLRALWIKNASGQILDSGTFNIIDSGTFAGEGLIETVHPDERRLLSYAADTAVRVTTDNESKDLPVSRIQILKGVMFISREHRNKLKYTVHNADTAARQVVIEHPVREGWKLVEANKPEETSATHYRFRVVVDPNKTNELNVEEFHTDTTSSALTDLTDDQVQVLIAENNITPELQAAFHRVLDQKNKISDLQAQINLREKELNEINRDQARIRENMKALKGSTEEKALLQRYTRQLDSQEDRLSSLHKEIADLQQKKTEEQQKLEDMVQHITLT